MDLKRFQAVYYAARLFHPRVKVTARLPLAIARQETGLGTTGVGVSCNNLFGMNKPAVRKTTATGATSKGIAIFNSQESSILDYLHFLDDLDLHDDEKLWKYIADLRYNKNPTYPATIERIVAQQMADIIPPAQFYALGTASAVALACAVKLVTTLIKKV